MPHITTIEEFYEYRMKMITKKLLSELESDHPKDGEALFDIIDNNRQHFATLIIDDMVEWMFEDDWHNLIFS